MPAFRRMVASADRVLPLAGVRSAPAVVRSGEGRQELAYGRLQLGNLLLQETKLRLLLIRLAFCGRQLVGPLAELRVVRSKLLCPLAGCPPQCSTPAR